MGDRMKVYAHGCYVGTTGFNNHTRDFFRQLKKHLDIKVRNFTVGESWNGYSLFPHEGEKNLLPIDKEILYKQTTSEGDGRRVDQDIYPSEDKKFSHDFNLILCETNHHYFYDPYDGPKIGYNVWESTLQPWDFFERLKSFDEVWVPSKWQKKCMIDQGYDESKIQVVPEGVDSSTFFPEKVDALDIYKDGRFKFLLFGRWDYRKSTKEIIETFLKTFDPSEPVDLVVSIDNMWGERIDGMKSTEERLKYYGLDDPRIKVLHFPSREDYIKILKTGHVFVSCARSEGWNLPLIEAMACGTPSIYSNCSAQLEFAEGKGIPVEIIGEKLASENSYGRYSMSDVPGNHYEPNFEDLSRKMRLSYDFYDELKKNAIEDSKKIREEFNWERIGQIGFEACQNFYNKVTSSEYKKEKTENKIIVTYLDGPKVEIIGDEKKEYRVEFSTDQGEILHSTTIENGMWTTCSRKYYTNWKIKVNGEIINSFSLNGKRVLISLESKSLGDTIAWAPYAIEFSKKHDCKVILSTFYNDFFVGLDSYKDIDFIPPGGSTQCYAVYRIGWFRGDNGWNRFDCYPNQINLVPLQQTATDILGLEFKEINYGVNLPPKFRPIENKYVVFGPNATSGCKEWDYNNWVSLSKMLREIGYSIVILTQSPFYIEGCKNIWGESFEEVSNYLHHAEVFVGLGSGLSWLNWALGKHTYMINGFSRDGHEFSERITKIYNDNTCIFCWNDEVFVFDVGDWDWCPVYKGTSKQHVCQRSITSLQVFNKLNL